MYKCLVSALVLSFFYCVCVIGSTFNDPNNEDLKVDEELYKNFHQVRIHDPYEKVNRSIYKFNKVVNKFIIVPPIKIYSTIAPSLVKKGISSFIDNLKEPLNTLYGILQLKPKVAFDSFFRFFINSTFGMLGMFDVAELAGLKKENISFADVLRYYGAKEGPYIMLPLLGPSTVRCSFGLVIDVAANPLNMINYKDRQKLMAYYYGGDILVARERIIGNEKTLSEVSIDEYAALRNFYYQGLAKSSGKDN